MRAPIADRPRRVVGWLLLTVGLLATSLVYDSFMVRSLVLDPDVVVDATDGILERRIVQSTVADQIVEAAQSQLLPPGTTSSATVHITDDLRQAGIELTRTPEFHDAYASAVRALHRYIFIDHTTAPVLDLSALVPAFRKEAIAVNPAYAQLLPAQAPLKITIAESAPDLTGLKRSLDRRFSTLAMAAAGLIALAMLVHSRRPSALRRIGVWLVAFALLQGAIALLLPVLASGLPGNSSIIGEHLARSLMPRLIAPAIAILLFGVGAFICARRWQRLHDERNERAGANAFLDPDHLLRISSTGAPAVAGADFFTDSEPTTAGATVFDVASPPFQPVGASRPRGPRRRSAPVKAPPSPAALFDAPETRSPPVDSSR
ncbi:MAG: hypothetical protein ABIQ73_30945 [Acidimicrobiales bacterium]